jgi:hypothetical protein
MFSMQPSQPDGFSPVAAAGKSFKAGMISHPGLDSLSS